MAGAVDVDLVARDAVVAQQGAGLLDPLVLLLLVLHEEAHRQPNAPLGLPDVLAGVLVELRVLGQDHVGLAALLVGLENLKLRSSLYCT